MKKINVLFSLIIIFSLTFVFAQESPLHRVGLKYDFRILLQETLEHEFDILHYRFEWTFDFASQFLEGRAVIESKSLVDNLDKILLHLEDNMVVTQISQKLDPITFLHSNDLLEIFLDRSYQDGEEFEVEIAYHGTPQGGLNFSFHENQPIIWSLDEPTRARNWMPCYDSPDDKATAELHITVPQDMIAISNGSLIDVIENSDNTVTFVWRENYPISTYLLSVAATNYVTFYDDYFSGAKAMEVHYYAYPEHLAQVQEDFSITVPMIEFYSDLFGEYPFLDEKYGMAEIPGGTSMEHQTCTSLSSLAVTGFHRYDWLIAHELAHQWWGDLVTLTDWADIWLNEGFATYSDALWQEHLYGFEGLKSRMADIRRIYLLQHQGPDHPIYNPPLGHLFCEIEYGKAAWVLHMLRFVVGESDFFSILRKYAQDYAYSNATTEDFRSICETIYGADLGWFFDQWIYGAGYPTYQFVWANSGGNRVRAAINQTQENLPLFKMPLEIQFVFPSRVEKRVVWVENKHNIFDFTLEERPSDVLFDPDSWTLCVVEDFLKKGKIKR